VTTQETNSCTSCSISQNGEAATCNCQSESRQSSHLGENIRNAGLFTIACITSPCCTPLLLPLVLSLFAGTSFAFWLTQHLAWVYGVLSLVSVLSLVLMFRKTQKPKAKAVNLISISSISLGEKQHVNTTE
jgi:hypothetical protein